MRRGNIVRFEQAGIWFYGEIEEVLDDGDVMCRIIESQSWPDLALAGIILGRRYRMRGGSALSVVQAAH